jgi:histidine triad (HIT) family protein
MVRDRDCPFCDIVAGDAPATVVYEDKVAIAFLPLNPATKGHTLVIPRTHVRDFFELDAGLAASLSTAVLRTANAVRLAVHPEGTNLITSSGTAAQQTVFHLHIHILPRFTHDRVGDIWPEARRMAAGDMQALSRAIAGAVSALSGNDAHGSPR